MSLTGSNTSVDVPKFKSAIASDLKIPEENINVTYVKSPARKRIEGDYLQIDIILARNETLADPTVLNNVRIPPPSPSTFRSFMVSSFKPHPYALQLEPTPFANFHRLHPPPLFF